MHTDAKAALAHLAERVTRLPAASSKIILQKSCEDIAADLRELARGGRIESVRSIVR